MFNVAIIGAGQLGSRHLQGLKGASAPLAIYVVDSSSDSLQVAKNRYDSIEAKGEKQICYLCDIEKLPDTIDLAIIATGSKPRAAIVKSVLSMKIVRNMVLEKVLFPLLSDYDEIGELIEEKNVNCWVNCPRRMYGMYQEIAKLIDKNQPVKMVYGEENWGLCCNAIHEIDIFMYITGEDKYSIDTTKINKLIEPSKRCGYIEMTGTLEINTHNGGQLLLTSINGFKGKAGISIVNGSSHFFIDESHGSWRFGEIDHSFPVPYQSQLTGLLADEILIEGSCCLSTYEQSSAYHKPFIEALLDKYNEIIGEKENKLLPIT